MKEIYCDGSCLGNPGPGGWGVWLKSKELTTEVYGHQAQTTNNQMELQAAIVAAQFVNASETVTIHTDSQHVIKGITEWISGWKKNNWKTSSKTPVKNQELWQALDAAVAGKKILWSWVRGHNGNEGNEIVDRLAKMGANGKSNAHMLPELIHKTQLVEKPVKPSPVSLYSLVRNKRGDIFTIVDDKAVIYPDKEAFLLVSATRSKMTIEKSLLYSDFVVVKSEKSYSICLAAQKYIHENEAQKYKALREKCRHEIVQMHDSAECSICKKSFGWYCPDSPDSVCHYYSEAGRVELIDSTHIPVPAEHDANHESDDWCIFCGAPEERK